MKELMEISTMSGFLVTRVSDVISGKARRVQRRWYIITETVSFVWQRTKPFQLSRRRTWKSQSYILKKQKKMIYDVFKNRWK